MKRVVTPAICALLLPTLAPPLAGALPDPAPVPDPGYDTITYLIGKCWDPSQPVTVQPTQVKYNCDGTSVMENMQWTSWGPDGAIGTGTDNSVQCQPNCAMGPRLINPIVVRAWNPRPATDEGCPANLQFYSDITVAYPQGVPPWIRPGEQWSPDTSFITVDNMPAVYFVDQGPQSCAPAP